MSRGKTASLSHSVFGNMNRAGGDVNSKNACCVKGIKLFWKSKYLSRNPETMEFGRKHKIIHFGENTSQIILSLILCNFLRKKIPRMYLQIFRTTSI